MTFKQQVIENYRQVLLNKINLLQTTLTDLQESTKNETKSSAGDKYETGRAMLQIEQDNIRKQLQEALQQKAQFNAIGNNISQGKVTTGSLVKTNRGYLYISIALGKTLVNGITVIALSPKSPLGNKLCGLTVGEKTNINTTEYLVEEIS